MSAFPNSSGNDDGSPDQDFRQSPYVLLLEGEVKFNRVVT